MLINLARASIDGAVFAAAAWLLVRTVPRLSASIKTFVWWAVTARFVIGLLWSPIALPLLPAPRPESIAAAGAVVQVANTPAAGLRAASPAVTMASVLIALWGSGVMLSLALGWRRWRAVRRAIDESSAAPASIDAMTCDVASRLRLAQVPAVRLSDAIGTPLVAGLLRPIVLVPADRFTELPAERQRMALCHELAHVARGDLWFGCASALAERLFFFHPLAHLAAREYVFWREAACDAAVLDALGAAPHDYGRLLLDLGVSAPRRTCAAAAAAWSFANLKRRIVMLGRPSPHSLASRLLGAAALMTAAAGIVPIAIVARAEPPVGAQVTKEPGGATVTSQPKETKEETAFVLFIGEHQTTMSGSTDDMAHARRLRRDGAPMLWFRRGGTEYVVRDQAVLRQVQDLWQRVSEIGNEQGRIGEKQGAIGTAQGALGTRQGAIGAEQGILGAQQAMLAERQARVAMRESLADTPAERTALRQEHDALEAQLHDMDRRMNALEPKLRELERPMQDLSDQMNALSAQMDALSRKMNDASEEANAAMRDLIDRVIASGIAQVVR